MTLMLSMILTGTATSRTRWDPLLDSPEVGRPRGISSTTCTDTSRLYFCKNVVFLAIAALRLSKTFVLWMIGVAADAGCDALPCTPLSC